MEQYVDIQTGDVVSLLEMIDANTARVCVGTIFYNTPTSNLSAYRPVIHVTDSLTYRAYPKHLSFTEVDLNTGARARRRVFGTGVEYCEDAGYATLNIQLPNVEGVLVAHHLLSTPDGSFEDA